MKIYNYPSKNAENRILSITNRGLRFKKKDISEVSRIITNVRKYGDDAVIQYTNRFDSPALAVDSMKITPAEISRAKKSVDRGFVRSINRAIKQITLFHQQQFKKTWFSTERPGTLVGQMVNPIERAGVYVPGGTGGNTPLVSTVLMCAIPAKIAGVDQVIMATPPRADGTVNPYLLVAAQKVGVDAVYKMGSAWGIAALAFGTETIPKADIIVGPGNIYVMLAKKALSGTVGTDIIAGPSEILIIADSTAIPEFVAADLLSQAEHDILASALLLTTSRSLANKVAAVLGEQLKILMRRDIAEKSLAKYGALLVVPDLNTAFDLANRIAAEHLELQIKNPMEHIRTVRHAGAVFIGNYTPEPVGDYMAGPNHVLPTGGTARYASALSVDNFIKTTSLIHYSQTSFQQEAKDIIRLAEIEGLEAHAKAVKIRLR
ncbi:MAG: histidinol dehydrogenase [Deltaproteobacteria bacterium]|nr:histidinol dehydrogenase [Deltaproteobacteria bacterium]